MDCTSPITNYDDIWLFIDADSCPKPLRSIILKAILTRQVPALFVADRALPDVVELMKTQGRLVRMAIVPKGTDSADDYLVRGIRTNSVAITRDVILAARLAERGSTVLDDRGGVFTKETVRERLSMRNLMTSLREQGIYAEKTRPLSAKDIQLFANALDRELTKLQRTILSAD